MTHHKPEISFKQDLQLVQKLLEDLQREQAALIVSDMDTIEALVDNRLALLQQLSVAAKQRYDALSAHGFDANEQGMSVWLKAQNQPELQKAWINFQKCLIQAKEMNRLNGVLINKQATRNQEVLNQLQNNQQANHMYGKNGQAKSQSYLRNPLSA